jgi:hypothetical protein
MSNFSVLPDLPEMYNDCRLHEDKDMTMVDFFTDHLLNFDGVFDKHENGDEQKPHTPSHKNHISQIILYSNINPYCFKKLIVIFFENRKIIFVTNTKIVSNFTSKIFRPPILT